MTDENNRKREMVNKSPSKEAVTTEPTQSSESEHTSHKPKPEVEATQANTGGTHKGQDDS